MDLYGRVRCGENLWFGSKDASLIQNIRDSIDIDIKEARSAEYYKMNNNSFANAEILRKELQCIEDVFAKREKDLKEFCKKNPELRSQINELKEGFFRSRAKEADEYRIYCAEVLDDPLGKKMRGEFSEGRRKKLCDAEYNRYDTAGLIKLEKMMVELKVKENDRLESHRRRVRKGEKILKFDAMLPDKYKLTSAERARLGLPPVEDNSFLEKPLEEDKVPLEKRLEDIKRELGYPTASTESTKIEKQVETKTKTGAEMPPLRKGEGGREPER